MIFKNFADQDWIGFNFCRSGLDSDWKISQSAHVCWTWIRLDPEYSKFCWIWIGFGLSISSKFRTRTGFEL